MTPTGSPLYEGRKEGLGGDVVSRGVIARHSLPGTTPSPQFLGLVVVSYLQER